MMRNQNLTKVRIDMWYIWNYSWMPQLWNLTEEHDIYGSNCAFCRLCENQSEDIQMATKLDSPPLFHSLLPRLLYTPCIIWPSVEVSTLYLLFRAGASNRMSLKLDKNLYVTGLTVTKSLTPVIKSDHRWQIRGPSNLRSHSDNPEVTLWAVDNCKWLEVKNGSTESWIKSTLTMIEPRRPLLTHFLDPI